ncbi:hypothetical protein BU14_0183s0022 [Porphyra umbilicalis]|uniref:Uncharacterized protein n=1 Tax=Porphyra umbilicalis TaxID=2786 RepID=A0A1X6P7A4_PORUM|nr:hypothetical protein BU14_0183s0022 [Porphyra umbilicalis]|eukprot:OSX76630.1 hypothetical protein BU14_0183s0022 [Porphyra umbilicalis]
MASTLRDLAAAYSSSSSSSSSAAARSGAARSPLPPPPAAAPAAGRARASTAAASPSDTSDEPRGADGSGGHCDGGGGAAPIKILRVSTTDGAAATAAAAAATATATAATATAAAAAATAASPGAGLGRFGRPGGMDDLVPVRPARVPDLAPFVRRAAAGAAADGAASGGCFVASVRHRRAFTNPSILEKMVAFVALDVTASAAEAAAYTLSPRAFDEREYAASLVGRQRWHAEAAAAAAADAEAAARQAGGGGGEAGGGGGGPSDRPPAVAAALWRVWGALPPVPAVAPRPRGLLCVNGCSRPPPPSPCRDVIRGVATHGSDAGHSRLSTWLCPTDRAASPCVVAHVGDAAAMRAHGGRRVLGPPGATAAKGGKDKGMGVPAAFASEQQTNVPTKGRR